MGMLDLADAFNGRSGPDGRTLRKASINGRDRWFEFRGHETWTASFHGSNRPSGLSGRFGWTHSMDGLD